MKRQLIAILFISVFSGNVLADNEECVEKELNDENIDSIAQSLSVKAEEKHLSKFKKGTPIKGKKMPWTLKDKQSLQEFFDDILRKKQKASRDDKFALEVISEEITKDRVKFWESKTGTLIIYNPKDGDCGTAHRPTDGKDDYEKAS